MPNDSQAADAGREVPKLAIWHLLLWMLGVAIVGAWESWWRKSDPPLPFEWKQLWAGPSLAAWGLSIAGLLLALYSAVRRERYFPIAAGHWLLIVSGLMVVIQYASTIVDYGFCGGTLTSTGSSAHRYYMLTSFALVFAAVVWAAISMRDTWYWRAAILADGTVSGFWAVTNAIWLFDKRLGYQMDAFGTRWQEIALWVSLGAMWLIAIVELCRGKRRDWLHWTGIGCVTAWMWC